MSKRHTIIVGEPVWERDLQARSASEWIRQTSIHSLPIPAWIRIKHSRFDRYKHFVVNHLQLLLSMSNAENEIVPSDVALLDLLRKFDTMTVRQLSDAMEVTATAVRQRLTRLMGQGHVQRQTQREGRGRPTHRYQLTATGRRKSGSNFADLCFALWDEIRAIEDPEVKRGLFQRIAKRLAKVYADDITPGSLTDRMEQIAEVFRARRVPFEVETRGDVPVLTANGCPYPELAEADRGICAVERTMFEEILGEEVRLTDCRLDGATCCTFSVKIEQKDLTQLQVAGADVESMDSRTSDLTMRRENESENELI
jgi:predicted ArsR family transcriptional regulator